MAKGRQLALQVVHYLRKSITYSAGANAVEVGTLPAGAIVIGGYVHVSTAFNAGTTNTINVGTVADPDGFGSALALGTKGLIAFDDLATSDDLLTTADTTVTATLAMSGTAASAGIAQVIVMFVVNNDG